MTIKRLLSILLCAALLLPCIPAVSIAATEPVVYLDSVNGSDSNDGLTEATAVATLTGAYTVLKANIGTATRGKIILVNDYTFEFVKSGARDICSVSHSFEIVYTGKTPQTALQFKLYATNYIGMKGPTTFENITVRISEGPSDSSLSIHGNNKLTIGEGVTTSSDPSLRPSLCAAVYWSNTNSSFVQNLTVNSGDWTNVYAGSRVSTVKGNCTVNFNGGTADRISSMQKHTLNGNATININGGTVNKLIAGAIETAGVINGDLTVNINGGTVATEFDPDGVGTLSGTATVNLKANNAKITAPGTINVSTYTAGNLTLGHATSLNITGSVSGTTAVTVEPTLRFNYNYITAPADTADDAFTFSQANITVTSGDTKTWSNKDASAGFTGLVLKVPEAQTVKLYPGTSGGSVITPDDTKTVDGYKYQYYGNIMGTYRYITTQGGYYSTTKAIYMTEAESLTETVVDATAAKKAGNGFEPSSVKDYSDEMHVNIPSDETALWWDDYGKYLTTPAFQEGRAAHQATTQAEMEAYINGLDGNDDNMYVYSMGKSTKYGYDMPIVIFTATDLSGAKTLEEAAALVNTNNKVTVHYQAQIHGNEPAAGEAALAQIGRLDTAYGDDLLKTLNIYVIPRLNPDGSYLYQRNDSNGINMNRDMLLAQTHEMQLHHYVYALFNPELAIDSHEYTYEPELASGPYNDMMIASGYNGNSGEEFAEYNELFARLPFNTLFSYNMQPCYYVDVTNGQYSASGTNYRGTRGSVSLLLESRGIGGGNYTYARRVAAHLISMEQILGYAAANSAELQAVSDAERSRITNSGMTYEESDTIVLEHAKTNMPSLSHEQKTYDLATGTVTKTFTRTPTAYLGAVPGRERARPTAYVIPAGEGWTQNVLDLMDIQDISYYFVPAGHSISLQQYTGTIETAVLTAEQYYSFENGCYVLPMNQPNATVLAILMEPDIADEYNVDAGGGSVVVPSGTLAQMEIIPSENNVFPIYRYVQDLNADGIVDTVVLPNAPTGLTAVDITVAGGTGSITGFDASKSYEYRSADDAEYTAIASGTTELTGLSEGTYYVRFTASGETVASADAVLTIRCNIPVTHCVYINSASGSDSNDGYSEAAPVKTIKQAYAQLNKLMADAPANATGMVILLADYNLGATNFTFPSHDYPVIFTAKTPTIALSKAGTTQSNCYVEIAGDTTFQNMTLKITSSSIYNNFNANGYNVVMGEGLTCLPNSKGAYFMLAAGGRSSTASTNLTVKSGIWDYIYAGGYTGAVSGDANLTITGGTVVNQLLAAFNGAIGGNVNISISNMTTTAPLYGGLAKTNNVSGNVTITLGEGASLSTIYAGSRDDGNVTGTVTLVIDGADVSANIYGKCKTSGTIGGFELILKDGSLNTIPTNVKKVTVDTTAGGQVSYPASLGVNAVNGNGVGKVGTTAYAPLQFAADQATSSYVQLMIDCTTNMTLANDLYLDLAGFDLGGSIDLNGFKLYGLDSTTDGYSDANMGYLTATVTNGKPEVHFKDDGTRLGHILRYVAVPTDQGYTFHRLYMGITHMSLRPANNGVGYKAKFGADDTLKGYIENFGYSMQLDGFTPRTATMDGNNLVSLNPVTLRVQNFDVENYGETKLYANVCVTLDDGTVIESAQYSMTFRDLLEAINDSISDFDEDQLSALKTMLSNYDIPEDWDISNITA